MSICYVCKIDQDCRPYGENGQMICYDCAQASPAAVAVAENKMQEAMDRSEDKVVIIGGEEGPVSASIRLEDEGPLHVYPRNDVREHDISRSCWCNPTEVADGIFAHHSLDGREQYETGERKAH